MINYILHKNKNSLLRLKQYSWCYVITLALILIFGIIIRFNIYFYNNSFWNDEAALALNLLEKSYIEFFQPLEYYQAAPPLFLVFSKFLFNIFSQGAGQNVSNIDLILRIIPCFSSIISLPLFLFLLHKMFKNKPLILISFAIFSFNYIAVNYTQEFKQYSTELMFSVILLLSFYSINIKFISIKKLFLYSMLFCIAPWFSFSSLFILFSGFFITIIDIIKEKCFDYRKIFIIFFPAIINLFIFFFFYYLPIRSDLSISKYMYDFWNEISAFFILGNFREIFFTKITNLISFKYSEFLLLFLFVNVVIFLSQKNYRRILLILLPILLHIIITFFYIYPFENRLILYLLPSISILYSQFAFLFKDDNKVILLISFVLIYISFYFLFNPYLPLYSSYSRKLFLELNKFNNKCEKIVIIGTNEYNYYGHFFNENEQTDNFMYDNFDEKIVSEKIYNLPVNNYGYIFVTFDFFTRSLYLKKYVINNPNLLTEKIIESPTDEGGFLIIFKKIK